MLVPQFIPTRRPFSGLQRGWRTFAFWFILPRLVQRFLFNIGVNKVKKLREKTVGIVEKYEVQDVFENMNKDRVPPRALRACRSFCLGGPGKGSVCGGSVKGGRRNRPEGRPERHREMNLASGASPGAAGDAPPCDLDLGSEGISLPEIEYFTLWSSEPTGSRLRPLPCLSTGTYPSLCPCLRNWRRSLRLGS